MQNYSHFSEFFKGTGRSTLRNTYRLIRRPPPPSTYTHPHTEECTNSREYFARTLTPQGHCTIELFHELILSESTTPNAWTTTTSKHVYRYMALSINYLIPCFNKYPATFI